MKNKYFKVLDKGFVGLVDWMGGDDSIVQAARVSYGSGTKRVSDDRNLIRYLMRHNHTSPFEMCEIKLHVKVPMDCWRQWIRHRTASVNEYCLAPDTKILKCDLTWDNIDNLNIGDYIVGFRANPIKMRTNNYNKTKILNKTKFKTGCFKIITNKGEIIASDEHLFVARPKWRSCSYNWIKTSELKIGYDIGFTTTPWEIDKSYDAGWLAGIFDGEGWLSVSYDKGLHFGVAQNKGLILNKIEKLLQQYEVNYTKYIQNQSKKNTCYTICIQNRWDALRLLGIIRPQRHMVKCEEAIYHDGRLSCEPATILNIIDLGIQEVVGITTDKQTLIANGFLSHNSTRYSEAILDKQETAPDKWRLQATDNKQGSSGYLSNYNPNDVLNPHTPPVGGLGDMMTRYEKELHQHADCIYQGRLKFGVAREQARKDLPLSTYTEAYWKIDLNNLFRFLKLRLDPHAQEEIRSYAFVIACITRELFPISFEAFLDYELNAIKLSGLDRQELFYTFMCKPSIPYIHNMSEREYKEFKKKILELELYELADFDIKGLEEYEKTT